MSLSITGQVTVYRDAQFLGGTAVPASPPYAWRTMRAALVGGAIRIEVDGFPVLEVVDPAPLPAGRIGFSGVPDTVIDDVAVWAESEPQALSAFALTTGGSYFPFEAGASTFASLFTQHDGIVFNSGNSIRFISGALAGEIGRVPAGYTSITAPTLSPDSAWVTFGCYGSNGGTGWWADICLMRVADGVTFRLTNDAALDRYPVWSPDGTQIAFTRYAGTSGGTVQRLTLDLSVPAVVSTQPFIGNCIDPSWAGEYIFCAADGNVQRGIRYYHTPSGATGAVTTDLDAHPDAVVVGGGIRLAYTREPDWFAPGYGGGPFMHWGSFDPAARTLSGMGSLWAASHPVLSLDGTHVVYAAASQVSSVPILRAFIFSGSISGSTLTPIAPLGGSSTYNNITMVDWVPLSTLLAPLTPTAVPTATPTTTATPTPTATAIVTGCPSGTGIVALASAFSLESADSAPQSSFSAAAAPLVLYPNGVFTFSPPTNLGLTYTDRLFVFQREPELSATRLHWVDSTWQRRCAAIEGYTFVRDVQMVPDRNQMFLTCTTLAGQSQPCVDPQFDPDMDDRIEPVTVAGWNVGSGEFEHVFATDTEWFARDIDTGAVYRRSPNDTVTPAQPLMIQFESIDPLRQTETLTCADFTPVSGLDAALCESPMTGLLEWIDLETRRAVPIPPLAGTDIAAAVQSSGQIVLTARERTCNFASPDYCWLHVQLVEADDPLNGYIDLNIERVVGPYEALYPSWIQDTLLAIKQEAAQTEGECITSGVLLNTVTGLETPLTLPPQTSGDCREAILLQFQLLTLERLTDTRDLPATQTAQAQQTLTPFTPTPQPTATQQPPEQCADNPSSEPWWQVQFHDQNRRRPSYRIEDYPRIGDIPRLEGGVLRTVSHHGVAKAWMNAIFAPHHYNENTAATVLMPAINHQDLQEGEGNSYQGFGSNTKPWSEVEQRALDDFERSNTPGGCRELYWRRFREEATQAVCGFLRDAFVGGATSSADPLTTQRVLEVFDWLRDQTQADPCDPATNQYARSLPRQ